nr:Nipped-B-like protein [Ipomoea batatas]
MHTIEDSVYVCPSFNSYSSNRLPEIAAKISDEFKRGSSDEEEEHGNDEFEFTLAEDPEFVYDGQSGRFFPVFNRDLTVINGDFSGQGGHDDESAPPGTYCLWRPRLKETSQAKCKKSSSTGSTSFKQWKLRDLLRRSNSEGKDNFVFITPKKGGKSEGNHQSGKVLKLTGKSKAKQITGGDKAGRPPSMAAHEEFYVRSRAAKETSKRKSYLPYRQDLLGFFANVNALGRTLPSF